MASDLLGQLERIQRMLSDVPEKHDPLPRDVLQLVNHAHDDMAEARGKPREYDRKPAILKHFDVGDVVHMIVQAFSGEGGAVHQQILPVSMSVPEIVICKVLQSPRQHSPNEYENVGGKMWYFISDLPITVARSVDATMHLETPTDRREIFHLQSEPWCVWHEKNRSYWSILTVFKDHTQVTEVHHIG